MDVGNTVYWSPGVSGTSVIDSVLEFRWISRSQFTVTLSSICTVRLKNKQQQPSDRHLHHITFVQLLASVFKITQFYSDCEEQPRILPGRNKWHAAVSQGESVFPLILNMRLQCCPQAKLKWIDWFQMFSKVKTSTNYHKSCLTNTLISHHCNPRTCEGHQINGTIIDAKEVFLHRSLTE